MKVFHCDHCRQLVFFENSQCVSCGHWLAYLPDARCMGSLDQDDRGLWRSPMPSLKNAGYRLCRNYTEQSVCNWAIPMQDDRELCGSCRLTRVIPDLNVEGNKSAWYRLETAKRRLVYSLMGLELPLESESDRSALPLAFEFLSGTWEEPIFTGHSDGVITINIAEADDAEREKRRHQLHEPYRTVLGHFRHEVGHYYWERLIANSYRHYQFRQLFGDERIDYQESLNRHYANGPSAGWEQQFISAYASSHPWEDWAETWAHYLHMFDALETAVRLGAVAAPARSR